MANLDDTLPKTNNPQAGEDNDLSKTRPQQASSQSVDEAAGISNLDETMPSTIRQDDMIDSASAGNLDETLLTEVDLTPTEEGTSDDQGVTGKKPVGRRLSWLLFTFLGLLCLGLVAAMSAFGGYRSGIGLRQNAEATQIVQHIQEQFELGVQEMEQGEYYRARQRFEYVIQLDPDYPGVTEKLADVLLELNTTATPTLVPTPTLTPTPDLRGVEDLFSQGQQYLADSEWTKAIDTLLLLRKTDPEYRAVEIDGMLYLALRNRGIDKIGKQADLEGGIYDLSLAERFGPLDTEAQGFLNWASLYITGASFWQIDWGQAAYYFGQVAPHLPSLRDGSGWTAQERYHMALIEYGFVLANAKQWCESQSQFEIALMIAPDDEAQEAWAIVAERCAKLSEPQGDQEQGGEQPTPEGP